MSNIWVYRSSNLTCLSEISVLSFPACDIVCLMSRKFHRVHVEPAKTARSANVEFGGIPRVAAFDRSKNEPSPFVVCAS